MLNKRQNKINLPVINERELTPRSLTGDFSFLSTTRTICIFTILSIIPFSLAGRDNDTLYNPSVSSKLSLEQPIHYNKGLCWQFSVGTLAGKKENEDSKGLPSYLLLVSYKFNPWVSTGLGLGIDIMDYMAVPAFADFKMLMPVRRTYYPYLYFKSGHSFIVNDEDQLNHHEIRHKGGLFLGTGAGILLPGRGEDFRWFIQAGFRYNELKTDVFYPWTNRQMTLVHVYRRLELRIGVFFS